jgi:hypothetical protein
MGQTDQQVPLEETGDSFWRRLILPEEDKLALGLSPWEGIGYRWFRSANVIPIEQERRRRRGPG